MSQKILNKKLMGIHWWKKFSTEEFHLGCHSNGTLSDGSGLEVQWQEPSMLDYLGYAVFFMQHNLFLFFLLWMSK